MRGLYKLYIVISMTYLFTPQVAISSTDKEFASVLGDIETVSIATGYKQPINLAPAVAFVIGEEDFQATGMTTLGEVLELVPGVHNLFRFQGDHFVFRGIRSDGNFNPDVLVMIDGVPQNDVHLANQRRFISQIPLQNIKRVEVIKGPYSTLYGTDALAGVVNVITKHYDDANRSVISVRGGSYNTAEGRWLQKMRLGNKALLSMQLRNTDGHEPFFEQDAQTQFDELYGTDVSNAPGNAATDYKDYNLMFDYFIDSWAFRLRLRGHEMGTGLGIIGAIDYQGQVKTQQYNLEAHNKKDMARNWSANTKINYWNYDLKTENVHGFPDGAFGGAFPDGIQGNPSYSERHFRFESSFLNNGLSKHKPLFNVGAEYIEVYDVYETRNYIQDPQTGFPIAPLPGLVEVPDDERYSKDAQRTVVFALVQDEWNFAPDWSFTGGLRYDYYSDIGDTANPRLALVWATNERLTSKLLVGRGFRAPTFLELSDQKSLSAQGNPDLKPVLNSSVDMSFNYVTSYNSNVNLSLFYHELEDQISFVDTPPAGEQAQNVSGQKGYGLELDGKWKVSKEFIISGYYAYQFNEEKEVKEDSGLGPRNQILIRGDWKATKWRVNAIALWVADRQREKNDTREPLDDELTIDLNILYETNNWSLGLKVNNLFNEQRNAPGEISSQDTPLPERNVFASVKYSY